MNCFYKPLAIMHSYFSKYFGEFFLISATANEIFTREEESMDFITFYNKNIGPYLKTKLRSRNLLDRESFWDCIVGNINNNSPVLIKIDLYKLYYDSRYLEEHHMHFLPIKGYDIDKRLFYCLDTIHNDDPVSAIYKDDVITFDLLWESCYKGESYILERESQQCNVEDLMNRLLEDIKNYDLIRVQEYFRNPDKDRIYEGMQIVNTKLPYYTEVIKLLDDFGVKKEYIDRLSSKGQNILASWLKLRLKAIYEFEAKRGMDHEEEFNKLYEMEREYFNLLKEVLIHTMKYNKSNDVFANSNNIKYTVINDSNVDIEFLDEKIIVSHNDKYLSNIWFEENNGPQIYFNDTLHKYNGISLCLNCKVDDSLIQSICFQDGIALVFENNDKYFFGLTERDLLNIVCFNQQIDYRITVKPNRIFLQIVNIEDNYYFKYKLDDEDEYIVFYQLKEKQPLAKIGVFSRTWEYINHKVEFCDIKLLSN